MAEANKAFARFAKRRQEKNRKIFKLIILKKWLTRKLNDQRVMEEIPMPRDLV